jgi:KUP system potassium uptake protein
VTLVMLGILGASLFYGDGMITPAISVLSAVEGVKVAAPSLGSLVLPITVAVITLLFAIQRFGTQRVGSLFGPVMAVWFGVLAVVGVSEIAKHPGVIRGLSPLYGAEFFFDHGAVAFIALAAVVLAVTGARGAVRGHGPFRPRADPAGLVLARVPGSHAQLPGSGLAHPALAQGS